MAGKDTSDTGERRVAVLNPDEGALLGAVRFWVAKYRAKGCGLMDVTWLFRRYGAARAAPSLHGIMMHLAIAAKSPIDIRCCRCRAISPDEERLLDLLALLQHDKEHAAFEVLLTWLPPSAARLTAAPAWGLAQSMLEAGLRIRVRRPAVPGPKIAIEHPAMTEPEPTIH